MSADEHVAVQHTLANGKAVTQRLSPRESALPHFKVFSCQ